LPDDDSSHHLSARYAALASGGLDFRCNNLNRKRRDAQMRIPAMFFDNGDQAA
jgi:hypothetical protein